MKSLNNLLLILTSCFLLNCEPVLEPPAGYNNGKVQGTVFYDPDGDGNYEVVGDATLCLDGISYFANGKPKTNSNSEGYFEFPDVEPGEHLVWGHKKVGNIYHETNITFPVEEKKITTLTLRLRKGP
ncbi:MAG: carboxypeptidase-like regulatory domain-containing protein [Nanoarchaeota archaeon]|nr:carboxypeptidase-like regulatory domain-containing protein [Nanoarchaeota archaeon]